MEGAVMEYVTIGGAQILLPDVVPVPVGSRVALVGSTERWPLPWTFDDGGRSTHFVGPAGDCVTRAIAVAARLDYRQVYDDLAGAMALLPKVEGRPNRGRKSARNGIPRRVFVDYLTWLGWDWHPTMTIGSGCKVHLAQGEVPMVGRIIVRLSKHLTTVIDGVVHDTHDPGRDGTRCVYGFWTAPSDTL